MLQFGGAAGGLQELEAASVAAPAAAGSDDICEDAAVVYASEEGKGISLEKFLNLFLHFTSCQSLLSKVGAVKYFNGSYFEKVIGCLNFVVRIFY